MPNSASAPNEPYDAIIVGGGPGGLAGALALGRARRRVLLCDSGPRRNAEAIHLHNFITRDGTPPDVFRQHGRADLARYPTVEVRDERVAAITGERGSFRARVGESDVIARRVLLATGMVDEMLPIEGFRELWGRSIYQCPYCHGFEVSDRPWGYLGREPDLAHVLPFGLQMRCWTEDVKVYTNGAPLPDEVRTKLEAGGVLVESRPIARLVADGGRLVAIEFTDGSSSRCEALFAHPPQRQVDLVRSLGLALDEHGFLAIDPMRRETSIPGVFATGDATSRMQAAVIAAASGAQAAAMINVDLAMMG